MISLRLSSAARDDLIDIRLYGLDEFGGSVAGEYLRGFETAFDRLRDYPKLASVMPELGDGVRCLIYWRHRILYEIDGETLIVLRVVHSARRPSRGLLEKPDR